MKNSILAVVLPFVSLTLTPSFVQAQGPYKLVTTYQGPTFFDEWVYYNNFDNLTNGDAIFVSREVGTSANLTFVNGAGNAIIKVDNNTVVPFNDKRNTVRISTPRLYGAGSVWTADMLHAPFGCSVWPAWWSQAPGWPDGGEIDTFENVNQANTNQVSLHTNPGCNLDTSAIFSGNVISPDCSATDNNNQGCIVADNRQGVFGEAFAASQGGMFVTEYASTYIAVWFFPRSSIPSSLSDGSATTLDTTTLGKPLVNYTNTGCDLDKFFGPQELILDITLCGDFAGNPKVFNETCQGVCYNDFVIGPPSGYNNAYFEIKSVKIFQNDAAATATNSSRSPGANSNPSSSGGSGSGSSGGAGAGGAGGVGAGANSASSFAFGGISTTFVTLIGAALIGSILL